MSLKKPRRVMNEQDQPWLPFKDEQGNLQEQMKNLIGKPKTPFSPNGDGLETDGLSLHMGWLPPGGVHKYHYHEKDDANEWYYFLSGKGKVRIGDDVEEAVPGTAVYAPAGEKHGIINDGNEPLVLLFGYDHWPKTFIESE